MSTAIAAEGLSKKYLIAHQRESYVALRDVLARKVKRLVGRSAESSAQEVFWALRDVNFEIRQGERVGIIGRNGAGKSTLLKILSRITEPSEGRVKIEGRVASLLEVGTGFHPELTGRENIFLSGAILGMGKEEIKRKFDEIVAFAEIEQFLDTPVKRYSSGMYVRLGFALAAHVEPDILIIDEVLAVGDAQFQRKCTTRMGQIGQEGRTILFVSHNMSLVLQQCERGMVLVNGRVASMDSSENAVAAYLRLNGEAQEVTRVAGQVPWLTIERFEVSNSSVAIGFNDPLSFRLVLSLEKELKSGSLTLFISNSVGARLLTSQVALGRLASGQHAIQLTLSEHRLLPGAYFVSVVIRQGVETLLRKVQIASLDLLVDHFEDPKIAPLLLGEAGDRLGCYCPSTVAISSAQPPTLSRTIP